VRNLAMRAAEAAKNTASLIEGTVIKVSDGAALVKTTNDAFREVASNAVKVGELVGEIAAASSEQAQGIYQVNIAVTEMDKVTQQNAANAEESASASEELNAQAEELKTFVKELAAMVGGATATSQIPSSTLSRPSLSGQTARTENNAMIVAKKPVKAKPLTLHRCREVNPDDIIPMEETDFKDF
jgi:methyl-accepting chemotaxis protein